METAESTQTASDTNGQPNPQVQGAQGVSQNSPDVEAIVAKVVERLLPELDKRTQSTKDKRIAEILKTVDELSKSLAGESSSHVATPTPQGTPTATQTATAPAPNQPAAQVNLAEVDTKFLEALKLDKSDPAVIAVQSLPFEQRMTEYAGIVNRRNQPPNEAAVAAQGGANIKNASDLWAELDELQMNDPLDKTGRLSALRKELGTR
jgi:hypothetical protein